MWYNVLWATIILAAGILVAITVTEILFEKKRGKEREENLCDFDLWIIDNTVDFLSKTADQLLLKEEQTKREALFEQARLVVRERLRQSGMRISEKTDPLIDDRIIQRIDEIGIEG